MIYANQRVAVVRDSTPPDGLLGRIGVVTWVSQHVEKAAVFFQNTSAWVARDRLIVLPTDDELRRDWVESKMEGSGV